MRSTVLRGRLAFLCALCGTTVLAGQADTSSQEVTKPKPVSWGTVDGYAVIDFEPAQILTTLGIEIQPLGPSLVPAPS